MARISKALTTGGAARVENQCAVPGHRQPGFTSRRGAGQDGHPRPHPGGDLHRQQHRFAGALGDEGASLQPSGCREASLAWVGMCPGTLMARNNRQARPTHGELAGRPAGLPRAHSVWPRSVQNAASPFAGSSCPFFVARCASRLLLAVLTHLLAPCSRRCASTSARWLLTARILLARIAQSSYLLARALGLSVVACVRPFLFFARAVSRRSVVPGRPVPPAVVRVRARALYCRRRSSGGRVAPLA